VTVLTEDVLPMSDPVDVIFIRGSGDIHLSYSAWQIGNASHSL